MLIMIRGFLQIIYFAQINEMQNATNRKIFESIPDDECINNLNFHKNMCSRVKALFDFD